MEQKNVGNHGMLDNKANVNLPFRQLLPPTYHIISFAKELKQFVLGNNTSWYSEQTANSEHQSKLEIV
jgi:hypothetical protein